MKQPKRILFIDDEPNILKIFEGLFRDDYEIYLAGSAEEGLRILTKTDIQVILCDQMMPGITGVDFFTSILNTYPKPVRILTSANSDYQTVVDGLNKAQIKEHLPKPWNNFNMRMALENAMKLYYEKNVFIEAKRRIFISHSSKDAKIVRSFVDNILKLGLHIADADIFCTSIEETTIKTGDNFREVIKSELQNSKAVVQIITKNYKESEVCLNEMGAAWVLNNNVIPFVLEPVTYSNVGFIHASSQLLKLNDRSSLFKFIEDFKGDLFEYDLNFTSIKRYVDNFVEFLELIN